MEPTKPKDYNQDNQKENNGDISKSRSSNPFQSQPDSDDDLFKNILSKIIPDKSKLEVVSSSNLKEEIEVLTTADYPELPISTALDRKIKELQTFSRSIEKIGVDIKSTEKIDFSKFKINYRSALNPSQLAAVATTEKPVLVIAGAGSGKTRVIVYHVSFLIEKGTDPQSILLLTFTRKSAREMLNRVESLLHNKNVGNVAGGTFHSFSSYVLRKYSNLLNLPNFTIIDPGDCEDIIDLLRSELKFATKDKKFPRKGRIHDIISYSRNKRISIREIILQDYSGLEHYIPQIELIFSGFTRYKMASCVLDFDDLMDILCNSLKNNQRFREIIQDAFSYIMVDEFQDTNIVQNEIVNIIAGKHRRILVVGDDSQSIYAFRGANYENILRFPQVFQDCAVIKVEENYRSNQNILDFTNSIIENAKIGYKKRLFTKIINNNIPVVQVCYGQEEEAVFIVDRILEINEKGVSFNQIAVLNRADWHNRYIQAELSRRGIPYVVVGGFKFNERMHVKDIVAYLRITSNPIDAVSWHRVLKYIGGVGQITASDLILSIQTSEKHFSFEAFNKKKFYNELFRLGSMLSRASQPEYTLIQKIEIIYDYYLPILKSREDDFPVRMQDLIVLAELSKKYTNLEMFLSDFALDPPSKRVANQTTPLIDEGEDEGKLTLSTVHSAKGLEWHTVFIPHALEGLFPSIRATNIEEMEEERRLFYVACSRAKEELYITLPRNIYSYNAFFHLPSRFLIEITKDKYILGNK